MATDALVAKYREQMVDETTGEPVGENAGICAEFYMEAALDHLLTDGGEIEKRHPKVKEIRKREAEALAQLKAAHPFDQEDVPPAGAEPVAPAADANEQAVKAFRKDHAAWEQRKADRQAYEELKKAYEDDLKQQAAILVDHHEHDHLFTVLPAGRPIFTDCEYIRLRTPGNITDIPERPVREADKRIYAKQYERFKAGQSQVATGTPLAMWAPLSKAQVKDLAYHGVSTVEQLAGLSDENLSRLGPYSRQRQKAKDWLATARGAAPVEALRAEISRRDNEIEVLRRQVRETSEAVAELRGRQAQARR